MGNGFCTVFSASFAPQRKQSSIPTTGTYPPQFSFTCFVIEYPSRKPADKGPGKELQLREKIGISFSVSGDIRFLSHQDMLCLFIRAIRRSGLSIAHTQGFNPRPRLWLLLPKPVGIACCDDLLFVELDQSYTASEFASSLARCLPSGIKLNRTFKLAPGRVPQPTAAVYSLRVSPQDAVRLAKKIAEVLDSKDLLVYRSSKQTGQTRRINIRPYLTKIELDDAELSFTLAFTPTGSAKPAEVLAGLDFDTPLNRAKLVRKKTIYAGLQIDESAIAIKE